MARNWPRLPAYDTRRDAELAAPSGWSVFQIESLCAQLPVGKRFEQKGTRETGLVPVIDQSAEGVIGWHNEAPGIQASPEHPVVTFANHTCEMRVMRRPFSVIQNVFPLVGRPGVCSTAFLYYATKGRVHLEEYKGHYPDYRRKWIPVPPHSDQRAIARILGALDDKNELNRKMNATLESMARALFKSWFVDFDPVRAKAEGRAPSGMDAETAKLFPSEFIESELGPIPKGWNHVQVKDVCAGLFDGPHATPPEADSGAVFLGIRNFAPTALELTDLRYISDADYPAWTKRVVPQAGDIVFTYEATLGFFALIPPGLRCCLGRRTALVRPRAEALDSHFLFEWFVSRPFQEFLRAHRQPGSTVDRIWLKDFPSYPVLQAPSNLVRRFEIAAAPVWARIHSNQSESATLARLRDEMLPRLLSGELPVDRAERAVEAIA